MIGTISVYQVSDNDWSVTNNDETIFDDLFFFFPIFTQSWCHRVSCKRECTRVLSRMPPPSTGVTGKGPGASADSSKQERVSWHNRESYLGVGKIQDLPGYT